MQYTTETRLGPEFTPPLVRILILITCIVSIGCALIDPLFTSFFSFKGLAAYLSLSSWGMSNYYFWQPVTSLFLFGGGATISIFWLIGLALYMYILWMMGSHVFERLGSSSLLNIYLLSGTIASLIALGIGQLFSLPVLLNGPAPAILGLWVIWTMLNPRSTLLLFFVIPLQAKWLLAIVLGGITLINLSNFALVPLAFYLTGPIIAYLYGTMACQLLSPYPKMYPLDQKLNTLGSKISRWIPKKKHTPGKIFDIRTGKSVDKEAKFMDAMLDKISKKGKQSLSWWEKLKMDKISKKRKQ